MFYETERNDHGLPHNPLKALIGPRPIGWITAVNGRGAVNLSPYSFFNAVAEGGSVHWGGLLSAKDTRLPGGDAVAFTATGVQTESGAPQARAQQRWTRAEVDDDPQTVRGAPSLYALTVERASGDEVRRACLVLPVFGVEQPADALRIFSEGGGE